MDTYSASWWLGMVKALKLNILIFNEVTKNSHFQKTKPPNYNVLAHKQRGPAQRVGPRSPHVACEKQATGRGQARRPSPRCFLLPWKGKWRLYSWGVGWGTVPYSSYFRGMSGFAWWPEARPWTRTRKGPVLHPWSTAWPGLAFPEHWAPPGGSALVFTWPSLALCSITQCCAHLGHPLPSVSFWSHRPATGKEAKEDWDLERRPLSPGTWTKSWAESF